jgi:hypothetical protein
MDDDCCDACGRVWYPGQPAHETDHIIPYWYGKNLNPENTHRLCRPCHTAKSGIEERIRLGIKTGLISKEEALGELKRNAARYGAVFNGESSAGSD